MADKRKAKWETVTKNPFKNLISLWAFRMLVRLGARSNLHVMMLVDDEALVEILDFEEHGISDETGRKEMLCFLRERLEWYEAMQPDMEGTSLKRNLQAFGQLVGLDATDRAVVGFAVLLQSSKALDDVADGLGQLDSAGVIRALAVILGLPEPSVSRALAPKGILARAGILRLARKGTALMSGKLRLMEGLGDMLLEEQGDMTDLLRAFFVPGGSPRLAPGDFSHLEPDYGLLGTYLERSIAAGRPGVNILIHGPPGTGKSELARTLCAERKARLYEISSTDRDGEPLPGCQRFGAYQLSQAILAKCGDAVILFDEIEDVFPGEPFLSEKYRIGKGWINDILESNTVPAIWISNDIDQIDKVFIRRFDYVLKLDLPPKPVRRKILARHLNGLPVSEQWIERVADNPHIPPALVSRAVRVVETVSGCSPDREATERTMERVLENTLQAMGHPEGIGRRVSAVLDYCPDVLNTSIPVAELAEGLRRVPDARICLYGPPGTGKTALGRHLAECVGKSLLVKRASDLLGPFVGMTERGIAGMFAEARQQDAVLMLDEADSFLRDRRGARHGWEVSMVNEMLTRMECHEGIFICSTNLADSLDQASLRRFDFKIRFDYMTPEQAWKLFRSLLQKGQRVDGKWKRSLARLANLTPGDFANVARQLVLTGEKTTPERLFALLEQESLIKQDGRSTGMGFMANI